MAERLLLICDLHDTLALATDRARLDLAGDVVELDLCTEHVEELRALIDRLLPSTRSDRRRARSSKPAAGGRRRASGGASSPAGGSDSLSAAEREAVREWARANGVAVSTRGRLAADVIRQYRDTATGPAGGGEGTDTDAYPGQPTN
jgi:hypothetical protein